MVVRTGGNNLGKSDLLVSVGLYLFPVVQNKEKQPFPGHQLRKTSHCEIKITDYCAHYCFLVWYSNIYCVCEQRNMYWA